MTIALQVEGCIIEEEEEIPTAKAGPMPPSALPFTDASPPTPAAVPERIPDPGGASRPSLARAARSANKGKRDAAVATAATTPASQSQPTTAEGWKDRGNDLFRAGKYKEARVAYSTSLALDPSCLAYANRAMVALRLGDAAAAERDCTAALKLDGSYVKAYQRRAAARQKLEKLPEVRRSLAHV